MPKLMAGAAKRIITSEENLRLGGYRDGTGFKLWGARVAFGMHDAIFARCPAPGDGERTLAFATPDRMSSATFGMCASSRNRH